MTASQFRCIVNDLKSQIRTCEAALADCIASGGGGFTSPADYSPAQWFNDTGADPALWSDISGNGNNATHATNAPSIVAGVINGKQVRRFSGAAAHRFNHGLAITGDVTIYCVFKASPSTERI